MPVRSGQGYPGTYDARYACVVGLDLHLGKACLPADLSHGLALFPAALKQQVSTRFDGITPGFHHRAVKIQAVLTAVKREVRLKFGNVAVKLTHLVGRDIGRIAHHEVERVAVCVGNRLAEPMTHR